MKNSTKKEPLVTSKSSDLSLHSVFAVFSRQGHFSFWSLSRFLPYGTNIHKRAIFQYSSPSSPFANIPLCRAYLSSVNPIWQEKSVLSFFYPSYPIRHPQGESVFLFAAEYSSPFSTPKGFSPCPFSPSSVGISAFLCLATFPLKKIQSDIRKRTALFFSM